MQVELTSDGATLTHIDGVGVTVRDGDTEVVIGPNIVYRILRPISTRAS
jgi:hypothetical protein